jgi:CubicO group peptidase (beta-lactamase class C family)
MNNLEIITKPVITCIASLLFLTMSYGQDAKGEDPWKQYTEAEDAGFSSESLTLLNTKLDTMDTASLLVIYKGHVLFSFGDTTRKFMIHSIRKAIMNAMIGRAIENGVLDLDQTLEELHIEDIGILTDIEKKATLKDLLSARSGVYHPSAYSTREMINNLPERGSHAPGAFWFYNNWDFNALLTIYEQQTGKKFFEAFKTEIADPIGMEDFNIEDTFYRFEKDRSDHPAYLMNLSARDMARFGQLYLNNGIWNDNQIIPQDWIEQSTAPISTDLGDFSSRESYGFLWWVSHIDTKKMYYASGTGGHRIMVIPESDLVIIHRVNTYQNLGVREQDVNDIVLQILKAKMNTATNDPQARPIPYNPPKKSFKTTYMGSMDAFLGTYKHRFLGEMTIKKSNDGFIIRNGVGTYNLYAVSENSFFTEDIELPVVFIKAPDESKKFSISPRMMDDRRTIKDMVFYY